MAPRIGFDNFARREEAPALASAGSKGVRTPASNVLTSDLSQVWRSTPGANATWLQIDLDGPEEIDTICLTSTNLTPAANWRIVIGAGDLTDNANATYIRNMAPAGVIDPWSLAVHYLPTPAIGESVRINLEDDGLDFLEVGRIWIGKSWSPDRWYSFGYQKRAVDYSSVTRSQYGVVFTDIRPITRAYTLAFEAMTDGDMEQAEEVLRLCGSSREILLCLDEESERLGKDTVLVMPTAQPISRTAPRVWSWTLECEERL